MGGCNEGLKGYLCKTGNCLNTKFEFDDNYHNVIK